MATWEVIVGNIGHVHEGQDKDAAVAIFDHYVSLSKMPCGYASGEAVTLMCNDEINEEHRGDLALLEDTE
jgi:hypothetical protein